MGKARLKTFVGASVEEENKVLALLQDNSKNYDSRKHVKLKQLGFANTSNYQTEEEAYKSMKEMEVLLNKQEFVRGIKAFLGGDDIEIIGYKDLVTFCKDNNLLLGKAETFKGTIPTSVMETIMGFEFNKLTNFSTIDPKTTVADYDAANKAQHETIYVVASPENFNGTKGFISNREVIMSDIHSPLKGLEKNKTHDNMIVSPLRYEGELCFVIIKIW